MSHDYALLARVWPRGYMFCDCGPEGHRTVAHSTMFHQPRGPAPAPEKTRGEILFEERERSCFLWANRHFDESFTVDMLWKLCPHSGRYDYAARMLRQWWQDGLTLRLDRYKRTYRPYPHGSYNRSDYYFKAIYIWNDTAN